MNLAGSVQYPVQVGWFVSLRLEWLLPLAGHGIAESGVDTVSHDLSLSLRLLYLLRRGLPLPSRISEVPGSLALLLLRASQLSSPAEKLVIRAVRANMDFGFP